MRKLLAIWLGKILTIVGKTVGKKSSSSPGAYALKICPDLVKGLEKCVSNGIIVTCGTNGKTTTNNLMASALEAKGYKVICNKLGANMLSGIATTVLQEMSIFGKLKADYACLEIDEAYTPIVFDYVKPDVMVITNLFRDQLDRYGEIDITSDIIKRAIKKVPNLKLVLNGDDPLCVQFGREENVKAYYYGISEKVLPQLDDTKEGRFCPVCGEEQKYNYYHYSQLGDFYCPSCGFKRPEIDFEVKNVVSVGLLMHGAGLFGIFAVHLEFLAQLGEFCSVESLVGYLHRYRDVLRSESQREKRAAGAVSYALPQIRVGNIPAVSEVRYLAVCAVGNSAEYVDKRGFTRSVCTDERGGKAFRDIQVERSQREFAVFFRKTSCSYAIVVFHNNYSLISCLLIQIKKQRASGR